MAEIIGTLNEHSLHAFLKSHYEIDPSKQEIKVGRYIADISNEEGITEIQTRGFSHLRPKLQCFLKDHKVTVVYPIAKTKYLFWVDPKTGETSAPRKSPKTGRPSDAFYELIYIKNELLNENLKLKIVLLNIDEYRFLDGWSADRKKGSTRKDRIAKEIVEEVEINSIYDYKKLLPEGLPQIFTIKDFMKSASCSHTLAQRAVNVLNLVGAVKKAGKKGRAFLYSVKE